MSKSAARTQFLAGVLCTFAEGGIQMIGERLSAVTHDDAEGIPEYDSVTIRYSDEEDGTEHIVTPDTIAHAFTIMAKGDVRYLREGTRKRYLRASRQNDAGDIDAADATNIVEIAIFGEVVYA